MNGRTLAALALVGLLLASLWALSARGADSARTPVGGADGEPAPFGSPDTCLPCHAQVVDEWADSMHAQAFLDPQVRAPDQSDNFAKQECLPCHAPAPIFQFGIEEGTRTVARVERRADGVDCLSCHALPDGGVAATRTGLAAPCAPQLREELSTQRMCYACHNQHGTHDEWRASPAAAAGSDCLSCHMPGVTRAGAEAGAPRAGASHRFLGGRDRDYALAGLALEHALVDEGRTLVVTLRNVFAGHNLPTDTRNRALDLVVTLYDARGAALPPPRPEPREIGCEAGTARRRFRNPYRASGDPNTQLPAGESSELHVAIPPEARRARIALHYKMTPFVADDLAHWSEVREIALR